MRRREEQKREDERNGKGKQPESAEKKPDDPASEPYDRNGRPPEAGATDRPPKRDVPAWLQELPPEQRDFWANADPDTFPPELREVVLRFQASLRKELDKSRSR